MSYSITIDEHPQYLHARAAATRNPESVLRCHCGNIGTVRFTNPP